MAEYHSVTSPRTGNLFNPTGKKLFDENGMCLGQVISASIESNGYTYDSKISLELIRTDEMAAMPYPYRIPVPGVLDPTLMMKETSVFSTTATKTIDGYLVQVKVSVDGKDQVICERHVAESEIDEPLSVPESERWSVARDLIAREFVDSLRSTFNE